MRLGAVEDEVEQAVGLGLENWPLRTTRVGKAEAAGAGNGAVASHLFLKQEERSGRRGKKGWVSGCGSVICASDAPSGTWLIEESY